MTSFVRQVTINCLYMSNSIQGMVTFTVVIPTVRMKDDRLTEQSIVRPTLGTVSLLIQLHCDRVFYITIKDLENLLSCYKSQ